MSVATVVALLDEGISGSLVSASGEPCGDKKRAVGRGPIVDGPRDFLRIGCAGGGFDALEERLRSAVSPMISCL